MRQKTIKQSRNKVPTPTKNKLSQNQAPREYKLVSARQLPKGSHWPTLSNIVAQAIQQTTRKVNHSFQLADDSMSATQNGDERHPSSPPTTSRVYLVDPHLADRIALNLDVNCLIFRIKDIYWLTSVSFHSEFGSTNGILLGSWLLGILRMWPSHLILCSLIYCWRELSSPRMSHNISPLRIFICQLTPEMFHTQWWSDVLRCLTPSLRIGWVSLP